MLTLKDVAEQVGVSPSTVSLVLNDRDSGRVKPHVAESIGQAAADLGYAPNLLARGLRTRQSRTLGLIADGLASSPFSGEMISGAQEEAWSHEHLLMSIDVDHSAVMQRPAVRALMQRNIEALIVAADYHRSVDVPLVPHSIPLAFLDATPVPGSDDKPSRAIDSVVPDEYGGAYKAVTHIIEQGHRRIAFCGVQSTMFIAADQRRDGYRDALRDAGLPPDPALEACADGVKTVDGLPAVTRLIDQPNRPTAVFCFSDTLAMACYQVARRLSLSIPYDMSVVGFDNQAGIADALDPGLTTVGLPHREMGRWVARQVIARQQQTEDSPRMAIEMPCPLIVRESVTGPAQE